jgi:hypothetical protein
MKYTIEFTLRGGGEARVEADSEDEAEEALDRLGIAGELVELCEGRLNWRIMSITPAKNLNQDDDDDE